MATRGAAPGTSKEHQGKGVSVKQAKVKSVKNALHEISEYTLSEFLENEPDLYSISDLKVRYR
jgi:hypothetical protein